MKGSSSSLDQQSMNNDDELHQKVYTKTARNSSSRSRHNYKEKPDHRRQEISMD